MAPSRLNQLLQQSGHPTLSPETTYKFETYLTLLQKWNTRTNLTAIRDTEGILTRHFVESILCARLLPAQIVSLLDFGSGAGFPGIPIALIRNDLEVTLAESQNKKSAFLREAARALDLPVAIHSGRAEDLRELYDCVTMRAVDHMEQAVPAALKLLKQDGWFAIMTTPESSVREVANQYASFNWQLPSPTLTSKTQILLLGQKL